MKPIISLILVAATATAAGAQDVNFRVINGVYPLDLSADGSAFAGNSFNFETMRWSEETGLVNLGRGTWQVFGNGAGSPDISDDGTRVSATITTADNFAMTQGLWIEGQGWTDLMPPPPADGGTLDNSYGSAWGLSGNGQHVVGLYWRPGQAATGSAHASFGVAPGNVIDLGSTRKDSRANHANYDGTVVVGWDTSNAFGYWSPTVWDNGTLLHLNTNEGWAMANYVTSDGNVIGGDTYNEVTLKSDATIWRRSESGWDEQVIGSLPGTVPPNGLATVRAMTPDGSIAVGYNAFTGPPQNATGFIWTEATGMIDIVDWLTDRGVSIPPEMDIQDVTGISHDGNTMIGIGVNALSFEPMGFIITVTPECQADMNGDGVLDFFDVADFLTAYGAGDPAADFNGDGVLDFFDVSAFLTLYSAGCP